MQKTWAKLEYIKTNRAYPADTGHASAWDLRLPDLPSGQRASPSPRESPCRRLKSRSIPALYADAASDIQPCSGKPSAPEPESAVQSRSPSPSATSLTNASVQPKPNISLKLNVIVVDYGCICKVFLKCKKSRRYCINVCVFTYTSARSCHNVTVRTQLPPATSGSNWVLLHSQTSIMEYSYVLTFGKMIYY